MRPLDWSNALGFGVYACSATITPIALLVLLKEFAFDLGSAGILELSRSLLIVFALLLSGFIAGRFGKARSLAFSCAVLSCGLLLYAFAPHIGVVFLALAIVGFGGGIIEGLINPLVQDQHPDDSARYLNVVNGFWSVGVLLTMLLGGKALTYGLSWRLLLVFLAIFSLVAAVVYWLFAHQERNREPQPFASLARQFTSVCRDRLFWVFWLLMFLAGGAEGALTFWGVSYLQLEFQVSEQIGALAIAGLFVGMVMGRFLFGILISQQRLLLAMALSSTLGAAMVSLIPYASALWTVSIIFAFAGLGIACLWPSLQSYAADCLEQDETMVFILLSCGGIPGYALSAWGMGQIVKYSGFDAAFQAVAVGLSLLVLLLWTTKGLSKRKQDLAPG